MPHFFLICHGCGAEAEISDSVACAACGEPMSILVHTRPPDSVFHARPDSMWTYAEALPIAPECIVSLGEGATPLVDAPRMAARIGAERLWFKNEMANPTGSFKDRQISVGIAHARALGMDTVAVVSSGNVACAAAAYAARAGMRAIVFAHGHAAAGKLAQAAAYGGHVIRVDTPSAQAVFDLCIEACRVFGWYHLSTAGMYEPFNVEGAKTIAYELYRQTNGDLPEWIVAPVGGGGLLGGVWRGFLDLQRWGLLERIPRLAGAQASGCAPLKKAIEGGTPFLETLRDPWPNPKTVAGGIADDILFDGHTVLPALRTTGGMALAVDDDAILAGQCELAETEGLLCEPTSAVVVAALGPLLAAHPRARMACILTGSGMKDLAALADRLPPFPVIPPSLDALRNIV
ncbi:MAG TPA: threonine synthase [Candidatus Hydrogenedentes bacterium]|nr:threonine synthase [Candidatus Hydrogenedentota bacterium]